MAFNRTSWLVKRRDRINTVVQQVFYELIEELNSRPGTNEKKQIQPGWLKQKKLNRDI